MNNHIITSGELPRHRWADRLSGEVSHRHDTSDTRSVEDLGFRHRSIVRSPDFDDICSLRLRRDVGGEIPHLHDAGDRICRRVKLKRNKVCTKDQADIVS